MTDTADVAQSRYMYLFFVKILRELTTLNTPLRKHFQPTIGTAVGIDEQAQRHLLRLLRRLPRPRLLVLRHRAEEFRPLASSLQV